jgi:hypothetical protein
MSRRFSLTAWFAALALLVLSMMSAPARSQPLGVSTYSCSGPWWGTQNCVETHRKGPFNPHVIVFPGPQSEEERKAVEARDRRWSERCQPLARQDRYGMPRYSYNAPGCEYGRLD